MKSEHDCKKGKRGAVTPEPPLEPGKVKISIRLGEDLLQRSDQMANDTGNAYQPLINSALREYLDGKAPKFEKTLRKIVREELAKKAEAKKYLS